MSSHASAPRHAHHPPRASQVLGCLLVAIAAALTFGCQEGGIGMGVPSSGARWGSGAAGPDVLVVGGPVYR